MNSPALWWTATRSVNFNRIKSPLLSRLAAAVLASAISLSPVAVTVRAENGPDTLSKSAPPQIRVDASPLQRSTGEITSFAPIVEKVGPSVVTILTTRDEKQNVNPTLRQFFGIPDDPNGEEGDGGGGLGSGVIISSDGLILTNNHVADSGDKITVRIGDHGHEYPAKVVGNDPSSDLALIRIDAKNLPVITFADSDQVKVGDVVLAVGNPFGFTNSVTHGIVSGIGRGGMGITHYENFIQTDASINPGNSGGALVDTEGRLIGINTAIYSRSGGNQGIGFAVPSNMVHNVVDSLLKYGKVARGFLGTEIHALNPDLAQQFGAPDDQQGALITDMDPNGPATKAGLQDGDIITGLNGKPIDDPHELRLAVGGMTPGTKVTLTFLRNGHTQTAEATLGEQAADGGLSEATPTPPAGKENVLDGITVGDLDDSARAELKAPATIKGVVVTDVSEGSVGFQAGLRKGDIILDMNHKPLTSADQAIDDGNNIAKNERVLLHVWSQGRADYLVLKPKEG
jgi:serine protease Do